MGLAWAWRHVTGGDTPVLLLVNDIGVSAAENPQGLLHELVPRNFDGTVVGIFFCSNKNPARRRRDSSYMTQRDYQQVRRLGGLRLPSELFKAPYEEFLAKGRRSPSDLLWSPTDATAEVERPRLR
jgi:hypothetical protein